MKALILCIGLLFGLSAVGAEPAKRPQIRPTTIPGKALCKDSRYVCMYDCTMKAGSVCRTTRNSDPNCPQQQVKGWLWVYDDLAVLYFKNRQMSCQVTSQFKTNLHCEHTKFGYECKIGPMRDVQ